MTPKIEQTEIDQLTDRLINLPANVLIELCRAVDEYPAEPYTINDIMAAPGEYAIGIAEQYLGAKADGTCPEYVKAVDDALLIAAAPEMLHQLICSEKLLRDQGLTFTADAILATINKATL